MLQTFSVDGTGRQIDAAARFFRYESGSAAGADEAIRVYADGNDLGTYLPGDAVRLPVNATRWVLTPASSALVATVRLGIGSVESARLVGTVRVVDEGVTKTDAGRQYISSTRRGATGGKFSIAGVLAGARRVVVKRIGVATDVAGRMLLVYGTGAPTDTPSQQTIVNKRLGGADASALRATGLSVAQAPTTAELPGSVSMQSLFAPANTLAELLLTTPIVLPVGYFLGVVGPAVLTEANFQFDIEEL